MKIALSFPSVNHNGGVERVLREVANFLGRKQHDVSLLTGDTEIHGFSPTVKHITVARPHSWNVELASFKTHCARVFQPIASEVDVHGAFCTASPNGGVLWVQAVHREWISIARSTRGLFGRLKQVVNPFHYVALDLERKMIGLRNYTKLIALTTRVADELMHHYDVPADDIVVLPNGVNTEEFRPSSAIRKAQSRELLGVPADAKVIVFVANEVQRKGFVPLLKAIVDLPCKPYLLAVGRIGSTAKWRSLLQELKLSERVVIHNQTSDVAVAFSAGDVFALPTIYEAWGLVIVEALASGLPVLTSKLAGASIAVKEGYNGLLLDDPHNISEIRVKLDTLLANQWQTSQEIADSIEAFEWSKILSEYEQILIDNCNKARE